MRRGQVDDLTQRKEGVEGADEVENYLSSSEDDEPQARKPYGGKNKGGAGAGPKAGAGAAEYSAYVACNLQPGLASKVPASLQPACPRPAAATGNVGGCCWRKSALCAVGRLSTPVTLCRVPCYRTNRGLEGVSS